MDSACQEIINRLNERNLLFSDHFWLNDDTWKDVWTVKKKKGKPAVVKLSDVVRMAYDLCDAIVKDYQRLCTKMLALIYNRLTTRWDDEVDGGVSEFVKGEMYLRHLYLCLKSQGFCCEEEDVIVDGGYYVGSRQQCLYGCVCFVYLLFEMCGNFDFVEMNSVDWLLQMVFDGGCSTFVESSTSFSERQLVSMVGSVKSIHACVFDLVNTKNPSGGMVGPGNCKWFHDFVLRLSGTVDRSYGKMIKNHAALHDAFGFLINQVNVGPGYTFGYYKQNVMEGSGSLWSRWCVMGQLSGLYAIRSLMKYNIPDLSSSFASFDFYDEKEQGYDGRVAISQRLLRGGGKWRGQ